MKGHVLAARDAQDRRGPSQGRHDHPAGRGLGSQHTRADPGDDPGAADCPPPVQQPALHPARHPARGAAQAARRGIDSYHAGRGGHRHPGRPAAPPPRRPPGRAPGRGSERSDRRRRGRTVSAHLTKRQPNLVGGVRQEPVLAGRHRRHLRPHVHLEHPQLRPAAEQRPPARCDPS
jgi:hypothetical protein